VQALAVAYYVEGMQDGARELGYLGHRMLLTHRMKPTPRVSSQGGYHEFCLMQTGNQRQSGCCFSRSCQVGEAAGLVLSDLASKRSGYLT